MIKIKARSKFEGHAERGRAHLARNPYDIFISRGFESGRWSFRVRYGGIRGTMVAHSPRVGYTTRSAAIEAAIRKADSHRKKLKSNKTQPSLELADYMSVLKQHVDAFEYEMTERLGYGFSQRKKSWDKLWQSWNERHPGSYDPESYE